MRPLRYKFNIWNLTSELSVFAKVNGEKCQFEVKFGVSICEHSWCGPISMTTDSEGLFNGWQCEFLNKQIYLTK
jgi:hypothetical protein